MDKLSELWDSAADMFRMDRNGTRPGDVTYVLDDTLTELADALYATLWEGAS